MSRLAAVALAVLLAASPAATAAATAPAVDAPADDASSSVPLEDATARGDDASATPAGETAGDTTDNTTNRLALPGPKTTNHSTVELDFAATMATGSERIHSQYRVTDSLQQIATVESSEAQKAIVNAHLDATVREIATLTVAEQTAIERYRDGEIRAETLLTRLAVIDARARALEDSLDRLQRVAPATSAPPIRRAKTELEAFQSPLRQRVAAAASGKLDEAFRVTASPNGLVIETILEDNYHRNTIRFDNRNLNGSDQINGDLGEIQERLTELYPWGFDPKRITDYRTNPARNVYLTEFRHEQGEMAVYLDGATSEPFREEQSLILSRLPVESQTTEGEDNVTVTVTRTANGGPVSVNVTTPVTDDDGNVTYEAVDATVAVDGRVVGETGADGELWVVAPPGAYRISVVRGNASVNVSVSP